MARSRNIKPSLFKNELLGVADPMLTILFSGLWCLADKEGRLEDRPLRIKAEIFPYRENTNINGYLTELERLGFIHRYSSSGLSIIQVVNFNKHQNPHKTEKNSDLPEYSIESVGCEITVKVPLKDVELTEAAGLIPDSLNLIPDSGLPITTAPAKAVATVKPKLKTEYTEKDLISIGVDESVARDFMIVRKKKRAPLTETALKGISEEAAKAGYTLAQAITICAKKNWQGFDAEWVKNKQSGQYITFYELATGRKPEF